MRIIAGKYKGKKLFAAKDNSFRPSSDRLKETLFNIITSNLRKYLIDQNILDIFAGSGALGLESLSRSAKHVTFVEKNIPTCKIINQNIPVNETGNYNIINKDFLETTPKNYYLKYSLVFLDPPYHKSLLLPALSHLIKLNILEEDALIITESAMEEEIFVAAFPQLEHSLTKNIGKSKLDFYLFFKQ